MDSGIRAELTEFIVTNYLFGDVTRSRATMTHWWRRALSTPPACSSSSNSLNRISESRSLKPRPCRGTWAVFPPSPRSSWASGLITSPGSRTWSGDSDTRPARHGGGDSGTAVTDCPNTSDYLLARGAPGDVALVTPGGRYTYGQLRASAAKLAAELAALDLPPGSRVGVLGPNSLFWVAAYLAVMKLGHVAVPFSDKLTADDVRRNAGVVGCAAVFADRGSARRFSAAFGRPRGSHRGGSPVGPGALLARPRPGRPGRRRRPDVHVGDDRQPESRPGDTRQHPGEHRFHHRVSGTAQRRPGPGHPPVLLLLRRLAAAHAPAARGRLVLCNSFVFPETALDLLEREECTVFAGVPSSFQLLLRASTFAQRALPSLRLIQQAGGKLPPVLIEELLAAKPAAQLFVMYGQTEATARLSYLPPDKLTGEARLHRQGHPRRDAAGAGRGRGTGPAGRAGRDLRDRREHLPWLLRGPCRAPRRSSRRTGCAPGTWPSSTRTGTSSSSIAGTTSSSRGVTASPARRSRRLPSAWRSSSPRPSIGVPDDEAGEARHALRHGPARRRDHAGRGPRRLPPAPAEAHGAPLGADPGRMPLNANGKIAKPRLREMAAARRRPGESVPSTDK